MKGFLKNHFLPNAEEVYSKFNVSPAAFPKLFLLQHEIRIRGLNTKPITDTHFKILRNLCD